MTKLPSDLKWQIISLSTRSEVLCIMLHKYSKKRISFSLMWKFYRVVNAKLPVGSKLQKRHKGADSDKDTMLLT